MAVDVAVPPMAGVYAYAEVTSVAGLPVAIEWVYVGKTNNLRRRLAEHEPLSETHPELRQWFLARHPNAEVWYTVAKFESVAELERRLIREARPRLNRIRYKK
ncbi:MAG TPA: GIY-YIG nuclease family protein [Pyrinomonadaceae bacterium]|nr:GIY-YIG nuclease family protein [Pyrinomonadaceae bacterium]